MRFYPVAVCVGPEVIAGRGGVIDGITFAGESGEGDDGKECADQCRAEDNVKERWGG
jgi:hypothetical protein